METYEEFYDLFCKQDPQITFNNKRNSNAEHRAFNAFFKDKYALAENVEIPTQSTNHIYYQFYFNQELNDVRIAEEKSGCFHSSVRFVDIEEINQIVKMKHSDIKKLSNDNVSENQKYWRMGLEEELAAYEKVQHTYSELISKKANNKPKM